jgi:hypothetical protein
MAGPGPAAARRPGRGATGDLEREATRFADTDPGTARGSADAVPEAVRPTVRKAVAEYQHLYDPKHLTFEVGIF